MSTRRFIPVAAPVLAGNEKAYVMDCLDSTWISSNGSYLERFERAFADFCGTKHALACCNGTVAVHLALMALGIGPGDEVIVPTLTFVATANAVRYCGARPVFVDSEPETWNLDPAAVAAAVTPHTKAVVAVHLYGHPAAMDPLREVCHRHRLFLVEDAAEAHGAEYRGKRAGSLGEIAAFSFYGNKIVTSGEGGMVVTDDDALAARVRHLKGQGMDADRRYWFSILGYNYRMTNIAAAIGLAQLEKVEWHLARRREVAEQYRARLRHTPNLSFQDEKVWAKHANWMFTVVLGDGLQVDRDAVMALLLEGGIETRPVFYPVHTLPPHRTPHQGPFPVAERIARRGFSLPTWAGLTTDDVNVVVSALERALQTPPSSGQRS